MNRSNSQFVLVLAVSGSLIACQSPRPAGTLRVAPTQIVLPTAINAAPIAPGTASTTIQNLTGQAYFGATPMSEAIVSVKDPITGKVLGGGNTDSTGQFSVPIAVQSMNGLFQIVVSNSSGTVQAIEGVEGPSPSAYRLADVESGNRRRVDWGSTLVAQTLGPKLIELSLTGDESRQHLKLLARLRELSAKIAVKALSSFPEFRAQVLATPDVRESVTSIINDINTAIVTVFRTGQGAVFQIQPFNLPDAAITIAGPTITIDKVAGTVTIELGGRTETLRRSGLLVDAGALSTLANSASLLGNPTTSLAAPSIGAIGSSAPTSTGGPAGATERSTSSSSGGSSRRSSGGGNSNHSNDGEAPDPDKHEMAITDILLAESAQSILGSDAPGALSYAPQGSPVRLIIKGKLTAVQPDDDGEKHDFSLFDNDDDGNNDDHHDYYNPSNFPFPGLIQQTFVSNKPLRRVLLDDSILLPLAPGSRASENQLEVLLNTKALTDLAISKLHRITVVDRSREAVAEVRVANESLTAIPKPVFLEVQLVGNMKFTKPEHGGGNDDDDQEHGNGHRQDDEQHNFTLADADDAEDQHDHNDDEGDDSEHKYLRITGRNLPVSFYTHWAQINGSRCYAHATWVTDEPEPKTILFLHLPHNFVQKSEGENTLSYANPFGFTILAF